MSDRCDYGDDFNALLREENAERAKTRPRIEITKKQAAQVMTRFQLFMRGDEDEIPAYDDAVAAMKRAVEAALNGDSK